MIFNLITKHPWLALLLSFVMAAPFMFFLPQVKTVDNVDYMTVENDPDIEYFDDFKEIFVNHEFFVIAFKDDNIFKTKNLELIQAITSRLEELEEVKEVDSLTNVDDTIGEKESFIIEKFIQVIPRDKAKLAQLKKQAVNNPLYQNFLISQDGTTTAILVYPHDQTEDGGLQKRVIDKTTRILQEYQISHGKKFHIAGGTLTNVRLSQFVESDIMKFIPLSYLIIILVLSIIFRSLKIAVLSFLNISICLACTMGFIAISGSTFNNITSIIPPLIMALALADAIHIFSHYLRHREKSVEHRAAVVCALSETYKPCFYTTLTTSVGFLSLQLSHIPPIKEFGLIAAVGVWLALIFSFLFLPSLMVFFAPRVKRKTSYASISMAGFLSKYTSFNNRYHLVMLAFFVILVAAGGIFISQIKVETNLIEWFKPHTEFRKSIDFIENNLTGVENLDISIRGDEPDVFKKPVNLKFVEEVQNYLASLPEIEATLSFADFIKDMNESFHNENQSYYRIPQSREMIAQYLLLYDSDDIEDVINSEYNHARIMARTSVHGTQELEIMVKKIKTYLEREIPEDLTVRVTGWPVTYVKTVDELVTGQVKSLTITIIIISFLMFWVFRSFALGLLSLIPNLFPVVLNFGIMGFFGIPLNTSTALIAAVTIGIIVDDTIHFLHHYQKKRKENKNIDEAIESSLMVKGPAIITTSIVLFCGFGVNVLGSFIPLVQFGLLSAIIMFSALLGDIFFLPAILKLGIYIKKTSTV